MGVIRTPCFINVSDFQRVQVNIVVVVSTLRPEDADGIQGEPQHAHCIILATR